MRIKEEGREFLKQVGESREGMEGEGKNVREKEWNKAACVSLIMPRILRGSSKLPSHGTTSSALASGCSGSPEMSPDLETPQDKQLVTIYSYFYLEHWEFWPMNSYDALHNTLLIHVFLSSCTEKSI